MKSDEIIDKISLGRTDLVFDLLALHNWKSVLHEGQVKLLQWFVYYNDTTALKAIIANVGGENETNRLKKGINNGNSKCISNIQRKLRRGV